MVNATPLASSLQLCGSYSLRPTSPLDPPLGDLRCLRLPTKHDDYSFLVNEAVTISKTGLAGVQSR
jgi:hypothetical protein